MVQRGENGTVRVAQDQLHEERREEQLGEGDAKGCSGACPQPDGTGVQPSVWMMRWFRRTLGVPYWSVWMWKWEAEAKIVRRQMVANVRKNEPT